MNKNSIITIDMISKSSEKTTDDLRKVEYNMLVLPTQLATGEYVDIRLSLPSGQDYIVVSKKQTILKQLHKLFFRISKTNKSKIKLPIERPQLSQFHFSFHFCMYP